TTYSAGGTPVYCDPTRTRFWGQLWQRDLRGCAHLLTDDLVDRAARASGCAPGAGPLCVANLVWLAVACALHVGRSFADVLGLTHKLLSDLGRLPPRPAPPPCHRRGRPRRHDP